MRDRTLNKAIKEIRKSLRHEDDNFIIGATKKPLTLTDDEMNEHFFSQGVTAIFAPDETGDFIEVHYRYRSYKNGKILSDVPTKDTYQLDKQNKKFIFSIKSDKSLDDTREVSENLSESIKHNGMTLKEILMFCRPAYFVEESYDTSSSSHDTSSSSSSISGANDIITPKQHHAPSSMDIYKTLGTESDDGSSDDEINDYHSCDSRQDEPSISSVSIFAPRAVKNPDDASVIQASLVND